MTAFEMIPLLRSAGLAALALGAGALAQATTVRVAPWGKDTGTGEAGAPFLSLERAAERVKELRAADPFEPVQVLLENGEYPVFGTLKIGPEHSGTQAAPVIWRGRSRDGVRIIGSRELRLADFAPVSEPELIARMAPEARGKIVFLDLANSPFHNIRRIPDYVRDSVDLISLFHNDQRLPLSRWPNGEYGYTTMKRVLASGSYQTRKPEGGVFEYREDRPARWSAALAEQAVWVRGFWRVPWVAETLRVGAIDTEARTIRLAISTSQGIGSKYSKEIDGSRIGDGKEAWYALNLLEEIDLPGEWSVDFKRNRLYIWLPDNVGRLMIADHAEPLVEFKDASHVAFANLSVALHMGDGISISGGDSVRLAGIEVKSIVKRGVVIRGGTRHELRSSDLSEIGLTAVDVLGGDRRTLTRAEHRIINNHIHRVALGAPVPALTAGLDIKRQEIVGCVISHNRIHDATYGGITFGGNENVLENNEIYRVGLDGGDLGGFYTTGGWTTRGNVVRGNFIHHSENANAIYMDDGASGLLVENNLIYRVESGVFIGGGHDHLARGNIVVSTERAIHVDDRGVARKYVANDPRLRGDFDAMAPWESPWLERYPGLAGLVTSNPEVPRGNVLADNFAVDCVAVVRRSGKRETLGGFELRDNADIRGLTEFKDAASLDFTPSNPATAPAWVASASAIASRAGLFVDEYRTTLPARNIDQLKSETTRRKSFDSQQDVDAYRR